KLRTDPVRKLTRGKIVLAERSCSDAIQRVEFSAIRWIVATPRPSRARAVQPMKSGFSILLVASLLPSSNAARQAVGLQALSPGGRAGAYMVYDAARGYIVLFGGWNRSTSGATEYPND